MTYQTNPLLVSAALEMALQAYDLGARQSGRTTALLDAVKAGDVVLCASLAEQRNLAYQLRGRGIRADVRIVGANYPDVQRFLQGLGAGTRVHLHHDWAKKFYEQELLGARRHMEAVVGMLASFAEHQPEPVTRNEPTTWKEIKL